MPPPRFDPTPPIFVNREGPLARFVEAAADIPPDGLRLLVFHGVGGQGKTALLRRIKELAEQEEQYKHLRTAMLDLHGQSKADPDMLLVWIRNGLAAAGVSFPVFDLALAIYWEAARPEQPLPNLVNAWLARSTEAGLSILPDALQTLREATEQTAETIPGLGFLLSKGGKWVIDKHKRRYLELKRPDLQELYATPGRPKEHRELADLLPWMLAQDLKHHRAEHKNERFVLLVDEYESLFAGGDAASHRQENRFDMAMRAFLPEVNGLLAVFGSRRMLPWADDPDWLDDLAAADCPLEGLKDEDAREWLAEVPIDDQAIADAMLEGAREENLVYPLLLDLQVAHWRTLTARGASFGPDDFRLDAYSFQGRCAKLARRLMRGFANDQYENHNLVATIERLCVANRFDKEAFEFVLDRFKTGLSLDFWDTLPNISFITKGDDGWLVMHRAVAEAIAETLADDRRRESVEALLTHFQKRATVKHPGEVTDATLAALFEASQLRQQLGAQGYGDWLFRHLAKVREAARFRALETLAQNALVYCEHHLGPNHTDTVDFINSLADSMDEQGDYRKAEILFRDALQRTIEECGESHLYTAISSSNLALNLSNQGYAAEARKYFFKSKRILESLHRSAQRLGDAPHPFVFFQIIEKLSTIYANIAGSIDIRMAGGRSTPCRRITTEKFHRKAIELMKSLGGGNDLVIARIRDSLGSNLRAQGRFHEALQLKRETLQMYEKEYGLIHPDTAQSYNNVAALLETIGRIHEAETHYEKSLKGFEGLDYDDPRKVRVAIRLINLLRQLDATSSREAKILELEKRYRNRFKG